MSALWFSRVTLKSDPHVRAIAELLLSDRVAPHKQKPQTVAARHKLVWSLFADSSERKRDYLWREDKAGVFFILSARQPTNDMFEIDTKPFETALKPGDRLHFSLRANPITRRIKLDKLGNPVTRKTISKVTGIERFDKVRVKDDVVMSALHKYRPADPDNDDEGERKFERNRLIARAGQDWLAQQGEQHGFILHGVTSDGYYKMQVPRPNAPKEPMRFSMLELDGLLEITDSAKFTDKLGQGFGSANAYGCGLMLIRRAAPGGFAPRPPPKD